MTFNTFLFAGFFAVVWIAMRFLLRHRVLGPLGIGRFLPEKLRERFGRRHVVEARNLFLLLVSYYFYGAWDYRFLGLLIASTLVDYYVGVGMARSGTPQRRRAFLRVSLLFNLTLLGVFKYFDFFSQTFASLLSSLGLEVEPLLLEVVLPVGLSFYTFQSLSYVIDVYRGEMRRARSLLEFAAFVAFFPQLVAGPIESAKQRLEQFRHMRPITTQKLETGAHLIFLGMFKKVVIADNLAKVADAAFVLNEPDALQVLVGVYAFAIQIYCDFSGYSDIARGVARCIGFELSRNFDLPYFAVSPSDFWRRWHISLSTWLRNYVYISFGGNRGGSMQTYRNLMLTMLLGGLWHGAALTYVAWGAFQGALLCVYRALDPVVRPWLPRAGVPKQVAHWVGVVFFFHLVCFGWLLFRAESMQQVQTMTAALFTEPAHDALESLNALGPWLLGFLLALLLCFVQGAQYAMRTRWVVWRLPMPLRAATYAAAFIAFALVGEDYPVPFVYFQF